MMTSDVKLTRVRFIFLTVITLFSFIASTSSSNAQVNAEAFKDYFLVGQFGEVCTMCEVVVLCEAGTEEPTYSAVPETGTFTLYHFETRTFWSQVSTIWEFFIANFTTDALAQQGHARPANAYPIINGDWQTPEKIDSRVILDPGVLELGRTKINRVNREWLDASTESSLGFCQRLPLWDSLDTIKQNISTGQ